MICTSCGKEFQNDMNFCPYCGAAAVKNEQQTQNYNNGQNYNQAPYGNGQPYGNQAPYGNGQNYNQIPYGNGQYYGNQAPYGYNAPNPKDVPSAGLNALAFFFPVVGLILYLVWKDETPKRAKAIGKWALISFVAGIVIYILMIIAMVAMTTIAGISSYTYMM